VGVITTEYHCPESEPPITKTSELLELITVAMMVPDDNSLSDLSTRLVQSTEAFFDFSVNDV
jgi:hypothetical protein